MFEIFYPKNRARSSLSPAAMKTLLQYRRQPASGPKISALLQGGNLHLIAISYAHGCCTKSLKRNREQALKVGVDEARSYGKEHLGPEWQAANSKVLSQKRGGGLETMETFFCYVIALISDAVSSCQCNWVAVAATQRRISSSSGNRRRSSGSGGDGGGRSKSIVIVKVCESRNK